MNLGSVALLSDGQTLDAGSGFVKPGESAAFTVPRMKGLPKAGAQVQYRALNDYGAGVAGEAPLK